MKERICYFIPLQDPEEHGGYVPAQAVEGSKGYRLMTGGNHKWAMPWIWGKTLEDAESACDNANERLGLNKDEVFEIIASTM
jgi:hypothetical protein